MKHWMISLTALAALAACGSAPSRISDSRAQALLSLPGPQHYATRAVAEDLTLRCPQYAYDAGLAAEMSAARATAKQPPASQMSGAIALETGLKRRSVAARFGTDYDTADACSVLSGELARQTPLSVLVLEAG